MLKWWSRAHALIIFSVLKILSLVAYAYLAHLYEQQVDVAHWMIYSINAAEDLCSAMLLVVMLTLIMQYSRKQYAGTDFTFQVAIMATVSGVLYTLSGMLGDALGYANYLLLICIVAILCFVLIWKWAKLAKSAQSSALE